jgi:FAD/FMN-containing dehydrogenase/Fe-S oxidoreductase
MKTPVAQADSLVRDLCDVLGDDVRSDAGVRAAYSTDSSNYRQPPIAVVEPRTVEAVVVVVEICRSHGAPLLARGGGTSLAGQTTNTAVVLDFTRHLNKLISVDPAAATCVVEPGIALDDLNRELAQYGLMFGPRPSTHRSCTIGGMIGNNSCGATAQAYGKTVDNVARLEVLTYDGARFWAGPTDDEAYQKVLAEGGRIAQIHRALRELATDEADEIRKRYPQIPRRVSGYNLDSLLPENNFDLGRALVGSEGTLAIVLQAELLLVPVPKAKALVVLGFPDIAAAADAVPTVLEHDPWQLEGMDEVLINLDLEQGLAESAIRGLPAGGGWLTVQFTGSDPEEAEQKAHGLLDRMRSLSGDKAPHTVEIDDPAKEELLQEAREAGLGATAHPLGKHETWEGWEDSAVPPAKLGDYLRDLRSLLDEFGFDREETSLYGHFGQGCVHTRIPFELRTADGIKHYRSFVERAADLVVSYGGSLSGEHGDGQSRGELLAKMFGHRLVHAFGQVKDLFDPDNRMNPGKVVAPNPLDSHLRLGTDFAPKKFLTVFAYPGDDNQFSKVARRCVGIGSCRNSDSSDQVMCPSYMVTRDEVHSTRGRARLLYEMVRGETISDGWRSTEVRDALDLCLACKGCKSDCPVGVDMATYKAEFLSHHYKHRPRPRAHLSMGWLPLWARLAAPAAGVVNAATQAPGLKDVLKRLGGIAPERELPKFATRRFTDDWAARPVRPGARGTVLLWPDTFSNSFHPQVMHSAVEVLEDAGFTVRLPTRSVCCGLTWISTGQLGIAKQVLERTLGLLRGPIRAGVPMVVLEPSCAAVFRSDGPDLLPHREDMRRLSRQTFTLAEVLTKRAPDWQPPQVGGDALVQTHCHQHAVLGSEADDQLLKAAGVDAERLGSGCCGLAGNFGFEAGHHEVSMAAAERVLLPRVRAAGFATAVLADGFSCRTQIEQADTGHEPMHLAQLLARGLSRRKLTTSTPEAGVEERII